jgi:tRNA (mo5U34)-methyltransferase
MAHSPPPSRPADDAHEHARTGRESNTITSRSDLLARVQALTWVHAIDLGDGIVTPGMWGPPSPTIMRALETIDFRGKKVLDIGCWDGLWSFEAEKRGATTVVATDLNTQRWPPDGHLTFMLAHEALASKAIYRPDVSVYDVPRIFPERDFDVVLFCGIYYHLRDPLLALSRLRQAMKPGGVLVVEGEVTLDRANCGAEFFYKNRRSNDPSNWWVPTIRCLHEWVESSYFDVLQEFLPPQPHRRMTLAQRLRRKRVPPEPPFSRAVLTARAAIRHDPKYMLPDDELAVFDRDIA